jgi:hypothetical protein
MCAGAYGRRDFRAQDRGKVGDMGFMRCCCSLGTGAFGWCLCQFD